MEQEELLGMLEQAMMQQLRSVRSFELLAAGAKESDRALLQALRREERRHYYLLEGIYEEMAEHGFRPSRFSLSLPRSYVGMLQVLLSDKLAVIDFYEELGEALSCMKQRELIEIILSDQKEQARILATVYKRLE